MTRQTDISIVSKFAVARWLRLAVLQCLLVACAMLAQGQSVQSLEAGHALSNLHVESIVQDQAGYIWMGTSRGLNRFDGYVFNYFYNNTNDAHSLFKDNVGSLYVLQSGEIVAGASGGMAIYDAGKGVFEQYRFDASMPMALPQHFVQVGDKLFFSLESALVYFDLKQHRYVTVKNLRGITEICLARPGVLWLLEGGMLTQYEVSSGTFTPVGLADGVEHLHALNGKVLVAYADHISEVDAKSLNARTLPVKWQGRISAFASGKNVCFITNEFELYIYNNVSGTFDSRHLYGVNSIFNVTCMYVDRVNNVWVGTFDNGYRFIPTTSYNFNVDNDLSQNFKDTFVTSIASSNDGRMWIGTRASGTWEYSRATHKISQLLATPMLDIRSSIACVYHDIDSRLWVAAVDGLYCYDTSGGTTRKILENRTLNNVRYITGDRQGNVWVLCEAQNGVLMVLRGSTNFTKPLGQMPADYSPMFIVQLRNGDMALSVVDYGVFCGKPGQGYRPLIEGNANGNGLLRSVTYIKEDDKGRLWMGTYGSGLVIYDPKTKKLSHYTRQDGLPSNDVLAMAGDGKGNMWLSTSFGLSCTRDGSSFINYFSGSGLMGNQFHERAVFTSGDMIYFTGNHGITSFVPEQVLGSHHDIPIIIQRLTTDKNEYNVYCDSVSTVDLSYQERSLTIDFAGLDYNSASILLFSYMLEGYDRTWSAPSAVHSVTYANLKPGTYRFKVRVNNNSGRIVTLVVNIAESPWTSWWAILIYVLVAAFIAYRVIGMIVKVKVSREEVKMTEETLAKERELNQAKINFFENVSHELRTPLSLIYGTYCDIVARGGAMSRANKQMFALMGSNIDRLRTLVEQILAFSRLDSDTMPLAVDHIDLTALVTEVMSRFAGEQAEKDISLEFHHDEAPLTLMADADKIDKVLSNLLSNAFKYTPAGGTIDVTMNVVDAGHVSKRYAVSNPADKKYVEISVRDTGVGVPREELDNIFERFYRSHSKVNTAVHGSGIGLYYVRNLVTKHKGFIKVWLNDDVGSCFGFVIPLEHDYAPDEIGSQRRDEGVPAIDSLPTLADGDESAAAEPTYRLLVVEDEPDMQILLDRLLSPHFQVSKAYNGDDGLRMAVDMIPDIVVSDVMMPGMNGIELCARIKADERTSHVPVVLLTAKNELTDRMSGADAGADEYIAKPFNPVYLVKLLQNVLRNRERVQRMLLRMSASGEIVVGEPDAEPIQQAEAAPTAPTADGSAETAETAQSTDSQDQPQADGVQLTPVDKALVEKLNKKIEDNIENPDYSIDDLASELGFSRSTFYRKIKGLTGQSPNGYIQVFRVRRAAELIRSGNHSIAEISDMTGFSTQSYFSVIFKKYVGMTPTDYKASLGTDGS